MDDKEATRVIEELEAFVLTLLPRPNSFTLATAFIHCSARSAVVSRVSYEDFTLGARIAFQKAQEDFRDAVAGKGEFKS